MMLHLDFETRSTVDLKKTGTYVYAEDPTTDVNCMAYAFGDEPVDLWILGEPLPDRIAEHIRSQGLLFAHNAAFERIIWKYVLTPRYGWPEPAIEQWRCTMVMAHAMSLPGALADLPGALGLVVEMDMAGHRVMLQLAKPRTKTPLTWWNDPVKFAQLYSYCKQDVETERAVHKRLLNLIPSEQALWQLDQRINDRGVYVDQDLCHQAKKIVAAAAARLDAEMAHVSGHEITGCTKVNQIGTYLRKRGVDVESIAKDELDALLARDDLAPDVRRVIEIRREAAKASVAKIDALLRGMNKDGRARGLLQFHAASTGRWGGRRFQPQNLKRPEKEHEKVIDDLVAVVRTGDIGYVEAMYGAPLTAVADCLRSMIVAPPGRKIVAADYSNIEGRVLAWLADEHWKVEAFRAYDEGRGPDLYLLAYANSFGVSIEQAVPHRQIGKVMELALGYQGGVGAFQSMAVNYKVEVSDKEADRLKVAWRGAHPNTKELWYEMERAAVAAVEAPGEAVRAANSRIVFKKVRSFLFMRLPSGRELVYPYPTLAMKEMPWFKRDPEWVRCDSIEEAHFIYGMDTRYDESTKRALVYVHAKRLALSYKGVDSRTRKWGPIDTYGGSLVENTVQAIARDIMADAMLRVEAAGYRIVLTVHDEIVAEAPGGFGSVDEFTGIMTDLPAWAEGCPIAADGWIEERYRK